MTKTQSKGPSIAVRNAMAMVVRFGRFAKFTNVSTRLAAQKAELVDDELVYPWIRFNQDFGGNDRRVYLASDEAKALAATSPLGKAFDWLKANGYKFTGDFSRCKVGYITGFTKLDDDGSKEDLEAWISVSQTTANVYINSKSRGWRSELAFEGKDG